MRSLSMTIRVLSAVVCLSAAGFVAPARAQQPQYAPDPNAAQAAPAHLSVVQGSVTIDHGGGESEPAAVNMPIYERERVITGVNSRAELMFPDGSAIEIDAGSDVELVSAVRVRVLAGGIEHRAAPPIDPRSPSAQNLPPDLQPYTPDLDQNGSWQYNQQYGNVWYPTTVGTDWRPYYDGYWYTAPSYGYVWVGAPRWAWPTHHYGRWGYAGSRWFWIPGGAYSSAWVSWSTAPGYVGWCPLGWDGRAVFSLSAGYRNTWSGWTVMNRDYFGSRGYSPRRYRVDPYRLSSNVAFVEHRTPPSRERRGSFSVAGSPARGVDRSSQSIGVAVPRYGDRREVEGNAQRNAQGNVQGNVSGTVRGPNGIERRGAYRDGRPVSPAGNAPQFAAPITPTPTLPQSNENDSRAYRPRYQPRYEPRYEQRTEQPRSAPRDNQRDVPRAERPPDSSGGSPSYRERRGGSDDSRRGSGSSQPAPAQQPARARERSEPRASAPASPPGASAGHVAPRDRSTGSPSSQGRRSR